MKKLTLIVYMVLAFATWNIAVAQEKEGMKKEGTNEAEFNADPQDRTNTGEIDSRDNRNETTGGNPTGDAGEQDATTNEQSVMGETNTTPAGTLTTSGSGSPGVLAEDEEQPDGTNTMQRAKPNIAGSPLPGSGRGTSAASPRNDQRSDRKTVTSSQQKEKSNTAAEKKEAPSKKDKKNK